MQTYSLWNKKIQIIITKNVPKNIIQFIYRHFEHAKQFIQILERDC